MTLFNETADQFLDSMIQIRRHLHAHPELSHQEHLTCDFVEQHLHSIGITNVYRPAPTSVCAVIGPEDSDQKAIAFRADLDALPINENTDSHYKSVTKGVMHACGHDVHTTVLIALSSILNENVSLLRRPIKLIFQQAEEVYPSGAPRLIASGVLQDPEVAEIYGFHVWPDLPLGSVAVKQGALMGAIEGVHINIKALSVPDTHQKGGGRDAIQLAAELLTRLRHCSHGRKLSEETPASITFGTIQGGDAPGKFAASVDILGSIRTLYPEALEELKQEIEHHSEYMRTTYSCEVNSKYTQGIRPYVINSPRCVDRVIEVLGNIPATNLVVLDAPLHCSEDFGWYSQEINGSFILIGSNSGTLTSFPLHSPQFQVDERVIQIAYTVLWEIAKNYAT